MAGFIRRYGFFPSVELIQQIEGVIVADLPPPGSVQGAGTGVACLIGEFADCNFATEANETGGITDFPQVTEIFSSTDQIQKLGGFDSLIGQFGTANGNGFAELRNKRFSRLLCVPVNLASAEAVRLFRELPTNTSATDATPAQTVLASSVAAGTQFQESTTLLVKLRQRHDFTDADAIVSGVDGVTTITTATLDSAGSTFVTAGVVVGDVCVLGVVGAATPQGDDAATYRITALTETQLTLETMAGVALSGTTTSAAVLAFRVHPGAVADSGVGLLATTSTFTLPAQPLQAGPLTVNTSITPTVAPPAITATSADPLSGLGMRIGAAGLTFSALQAANVANTALDVSYATAIDATLNEIFPEIRDINIIWAARSSPAINQKLKENAIAGSETHHGRLAVVSSLLTTTTNSTVFAELTTLGNDERAIFCWPGLRTYIPEAANIALTGADGKTTEDGILDTASAGWMSSVLSLLAPERNPGQASAPIPSVLGRTLGIQRGFTTALGVKEYIALRRNGFAAPRQDRVSGVIFQSGITTSLIAGQKNINRRRMADFIEDSLADRYTVFTKELLTNQLKDTITSETEAFLEGLLSPNNPVAQRIDSYEVDPRSGNTPELEAKGIFVVIVRVRTLPTADFIVLQAEIGEGVVITTTT